MKRKLTPCAAVKAGTAMRRGLTTIEWYDKSGDPQKYCFGNVNKMTDRILEECRNCPDFVYRADEDMRKEKKLWMQLNI